MSKLRTGLDNTRSPKFASPAKLSKPDMHLSSEYLPIINRVFTALVTKNRQRHKPLICLRLQDPRKRRKNEKYLRVVNKQKQQFPIQVAQGYRNMPTIYTCGRSLRFTGVTFPVLARKGQRDTDEITYSCPGGNVHFLPEMVKSNKKKFTPGGRAAGAR